MQFLFRYVYALKKQDYSLGVLFGMGNALGVFQDGRQQASKSKEAVLNEGRSPVSGFIERYVDYDSLKKINLWW